MNNNQQPSTPVSSKRQETRLFVFLVVILFPLLSVALVGGYGFLIWISQMLFGPPGPPGPPS